MEALQTFAGWTVDVNKVKKCDLFSDGRIELTFFDERVESRNHEKTWASKIVTSMREAMDERDRRWAALKTVWVSVKHHSLAIKPGLVKSVYAAQKNCCCWITEYAVLMELVTGQEVRLGRFMTKESAIAAATRIGEEIFSSQTETAPLVLAVAEAVSVAETKDQPAPAAPSHN